jgi:pimeloyl-ACP methyl ester carboxylesterase
VISGSAPAVPLAIDKTVKLEINGSTQRVRMCAERTGLPPILIVQAGPGFPLLHEVAKFQRRLHLEDEFLVSYWEQRGCGVASRQAAESVSLQQQADDLRSVLYWLQNETKQPVVVLGISLGATIALQAVAREPDNARSLIAVSPDAHTTSSDASVHSFLQEQSVLATGGRISRRLKKLGEPPYTDPSTFQLRARLLADLGAIERGKKFSGVLRETLLGMIATYGLVGTAKAMRNMNLIQRTLLPQLVSLDLLANPPRLAIPVHYIFGEQAPLVPAAIVKQLPAAIAAPESTVTLVPDADRPAMAGLAATTLLGAVSYAALHVCEYWTVYDSLPHAALSVTCVLLWFLGPGLIKSYLTLRTGNAWVHLWAYHAIAPHVTMDTPVIVNVFQIR